LEGFIMSLAEHLKRARENKGWSQRELGRQAGVRYASISELENGIRTSMSTDTAKKLARALGVSIDYLVGTWERDEESELEPTGVALVGT
jgi:transcriptional regulator with XRE-family HTH domain